MKNVLRMIVAGCIYEPARRVALHFVVMIPLNKHMTRHFHQTGHPVIVSAEPGERWIWCYIDDVFANID